MASLHNNLQIYNKFYTVKKERMVHFCTYEQFNRVEGFPNNFQKNSSNWIFWR